MTNCCEDKSCELTAMRQSHSRILWIILVINTAMFLIEGMAGLLANSTSLLADALDMLGDCPGIWLYSVRAETVGTLAGRCRSYQRGIHVGLWAWCVGGSRL